MIKNKKRFLVIFLGAASLLLVVVFKHYSPLRLVGKYDPGIFGTTEFEYIATQNNTIFILSNDYSDGSGEIGKLLVFDALPPDKPKLISTLTFQPNLGRAAGITVNGNYLYVVTMGSYGILTIDISNLESPRLISNYSPPKNSIFHSELIISNNIGYVENFLIENNDRFRRLSVLSMENPKAIKQLTIVPELGYPLWKIGDYLYIQLAPYHPSPMYPNSSIYDYPLGILDVSNPESPKLVKEMYDLRFPTDADANDSWLYFSSFSGILAVDISNPMPQPVLKYNDYNMDKILVDEDTGYFIGGRLQMYVVDLSSEKKSKVIFRDNLSQGMDFVRVGDYIYMTDAFDGLLIYKINRSTPAWRNNLAAFFYRLEFRFWDGIAEYLQL